MRNRIANIFLTVAALLFAAGISFADDTKAPAAKSVAKPAADSAKAGTKADAPDTKGAAKKEPVDINTASEADLKAIPGIGDAYAAKIIAGRPYANKAQLKSRNILPGVLYEQVKDRIIAKQPKKK